MDIVDKVNIKKMTENDYIPFSGVQKVVCIFKLIIIITN